MSDADVDRLLAKSAVFGALDAEDRARLAAVTRRRSYAARQTIFQKGDAGSFMMAVVSGSVRICLYSSEGREITLNVVEAGEIMGEIAVLDGGPRTADAVTHERVEGLVLERRDVLSLLADRPAMATRLLEVVCGRLRRTSGQLEATAFHELPIRLASLLLDLAREHGVASPAGTLIQRTVSQRDLARRIASTRESVNRQLRAWVTSDLIAIDDGRITVRDLEALDLLAGDQAG